jgi:hypothetical protein
VDAKRKEIALFRYRLIAPLVREARPIPGELTRCAREIAAAYVLALIAKDSIF